MYKLKAKSLPTRTSLALLSSHLTLNLILPPTPFCNPHQPPCSSSILSPTSLGGDGYELPFPFLGFQLDCGI